MGLLKPKWIQEWTSILKNQGLKALIKQKGWKFVLAFFLYYLIRDSILYIIIPYFALTKLGACN